VIAVLTYFGPEKHGVVFGGSEGFPRSRE
jgi:hypothetical protein